LTYFIGWSAVNSTPKMVNEEQPTPNWHFAQYTPFLAFIANPKSGVLGIKGMLKISLKVTFALFHLYGSFYSHAKLWGL